MSAPLGEPVPGWAGARPLPRTPLVGRYVTLAPLLVSHAAALWECSRDESVWTYLSYGPWPSSASYEAWVASVSGSVDPMFFAVLVGGEPRGVVSYLRTDEPNGAVEIGHIWYAPAIQRTPATTEAAYLLARRAFELGYRRFEWKCNVLNAPSRAAAERFGFTYEGTFRNHLVVKGRNRDTAWYAMTDAEWPRVRAAFEAWLDPANFDPDGHQRTPLRARPDPHNVTLPG